MDCVSAKRGYHSHDAAMRWAKKKARTRGGGKEHVALRVYRCDHCQQWHVTGTPTHANLSFQKYQDKRGGV